MRIVISFYRLMINMTLAEKFNFSDRIQKYKAAKENVRQKQQQQQQQQDGSSSNGLIEEKARAETGAPLEKQHPSIIQCQTSMALLFLLTVEALAIAVMESFIIYYHTMIFSHCGFSLQTLGLGQVDLIYHGIFIITPVYQLFLYLDTLRQRNSLQLLIPILFGKCFDKYSNSIHVTLYDRIKV